MTISVVCPSCHAKYSLNDNFAGTEVACFGCQQKLQIPALSTASASNDQRNANAGAHRNKPTDESVNYYQAPVDLEDVLTCSECGEVIGHDVETCPHCQAVVATRKDIERGKMPLGVRLLAYLGLFGAAMSPFGIVGVVSDEEQSRLMMLAGISAVLIGGTLSGACGVGYLKGYRWVWWYTMGMSIASVVSTIQYSIMGNFYGEKLPEGFTIEGVYGFYVITILVDVFYFLYFRRTKVKKYFRVKQASLMNIVLAAVIVFVASYVVTEMPSDLIGYFEGDQELIFHGAPE